MKTIGDKQCGYLVGMNCTSCDQIIPSKNSNYK